MKQIFFGLLVILACQCKNVESKRADNHFVTVVKTEPDSLYRRIQLDDDEAAQYGFTHGDSLLNITDESKIDIHLLDTLCFCKGEYSSKIKKPKFFLNFPDCDKGFSIRDHRIYTLDSAQKDRSVICVSTPMGDGYVGKWVDPGDGCFFVFKRKNKEWQIKDVVFGRLVGFDVDKKGALMPIIRGHSKSRTYKAYKDEEKGIIDKPDSIFYAFETRFIWDGNHLKADDFTTPRSDVQVIEPSKIKALGLYDILKKRYIDDDNEIQRGVKIHYKFRSFSLGHKNDPDYKTGNFAPYIQEMWRIGFRID